MAEGSSSGSAPPAETTAQCECLVVNPDSFLFTADPYSDGKPLPTRTDHPPPTPTSAFDHSTIHNAASLLRTGSVVAFPTETVYGLAANGLSPTAVRSIYAAKGRPSDNPLILHVSSLAMIEQLILPPSNPHIPQIYHEAIKQSWPGPLTILLPRGPNVPLEVTGGHETVAVRFPSHPIARALIDACGFPLAAPSANTSGRPSPTLASHVFSDLATRGVPLIIDGGACGYGVESTVLDGLSSPPVVLRPGGVTVEHLRTLPGLENLRVYKKDFVDGALEAAPTTPGMKYRHYTPEAEVVVFELPEGSEDTLALRAAVDTHAEGLLATLPPAQRIGILRTTACSSPSWPHENSDKITTLQIGPTPTLVAHNIFAALRTMEQRGVSVILVEGVADEREGLAVMNRVRKAASRVVVVG
ncbi:DHBP synthase RibB-like alpha/beta domain-containing protein [Fimicolochytrium jonesii]|uniref:DHBP synthase RibB-like alpha/beta domain-containing protein n=1 Tax=Fimicolochytrium jonesii TaxID=1396493 RepID=UPI0022FEB8D0|nr:DHBP synthase RibB-like alpha/beta domain-containing protein [Fimicolochytrium jonesii]KAI8820877.1 DHBP synthase RibB-like alpha/beta domain-containing protein [Fimicolochytrium jonesii]